MEVEIVNPITADPKLSGTALIAFMCRVTVTNGAVKLIIGDHVHYHAEANGNGSVQLTNKGPHPAKKAKASKAK